MKSRYCSKVLTRETDSKGGQQSLGSWPVSLLAAGLPLPPSALLMASRGPPRWRAAGNGASSTGLLHSGAGCPGPSERCESKVSAAVCTPPPCPPASSTLAADGQPKGSYAGSLVDQNVKLLTQWLLLSKVSRTPPEELHRET